MRFLSRLLLFVLVIGPSTAGAELPGFTLTTIYHSILGETDKLNPTEDEERYVSLEDCYSFREETRPDLCALSSTTDSGDTTDGTDDTTNSDTSDGEDTTDATTDTDGEDTADATTTSDSDDATDATDSSDGSTAVDSADGADTTDGTDTNTTDGIDSETTDGTDSETTDGADTTDGTDSETTDGTDSEITDGADTTDGTDSETTDGTDSETTDGTDTESMAPGKADATASYFRFSVGVDEARVDSTGFGTTQYAENYNVFVGSCTVNTTGLPEVSENCVEVVQNEDPIDNGETWASFTFEVVTNQLLSDCSVAGDARVYLIVEYGDSFESETIELNRDYTAPTGVSDASATPGEQALEVSWGSVDTAERYRACVAESSFTINDVLDGTISCTTTEQTNTRIEGLTNGTNYLVAILSEDAAGNVSTLCDGAVFAEGIPIAVNDFYEEYRAAGGRDLGGYGCATTISVNSSSFAWLLLSALTILLVAVPRTRSIGESE